MIFSYRFVFCFTGTKIGCVRCGACRRITDVITRITDFSLCRCVQSLVREVATGCGSALRGCPKGWGWFLRGSLMDVRGKTGRKKT